MNIQQENILLYSYIVENISTTYLPDYLLDNYDFYIDKSEIEPVFAKYNLNYDNRGLGDQRRHGRGFHLGRYKNGFVNNKGHRCAVTMDVIGEYMNYYQRTGENLEQFLAKKFYEKDAPPPNQPTAKPLVFTPSPTVNREPERPSYQPPQPSNTTPSYSGGSSAIGEYAGKIIMVVVVVVVGFLLFKFVLAPVGNTIMGWFTGGNKNSAGLNLPAGVEADKAISSDICELKINMSFIDNENNVPINQGYVLHIGDKHYFNMEFNNLYNVRSELKYGYYDLWVQSGNKISDIYRVKIDSEDCVVFFDCKVGESGPIFEYIGLGTAAEVNKK